MIMSDHFDTIVSMFNIKEKFTASPLSTYKGTLTQTFVSIALIGLIFGAGFYFGKGKEEKRAVINIGGVPESEIADVNFDPFWETWRVLEEKFVSSTSTNTTALTSDKKVWGAIEGLASAYGDPYTVFFPPVESKMFAEEIRGSFSGVGMEIASQSGILTVIAPLKDTPAEKAGVKAGDKILQIGDTNAVKMSTEEAISLIRGEQGTAVTITFARDGVKEPLVKSIVRDTINIPTIDYKKLPSGAYLIQLFSFSENSANLFRQALRQFVESGSDKLILDLRNNPGGYLEAAVSMASWFLPTGEIIVSEDFGGKRENVEHRSYGYDIFNKNLKFVILVNGGSASASEILAGALSEHGKAVLIGEQPFGKGSVQELVDITGDTSLKVTIAHWLTPLGNSISNGGLLPKIEIKNTAEDVASGKDRVLERAVEFLNTK